MRHIAAKTRKDSITNCAHQSSAVQHQNQVKIADIKQVNKFKGPLRVINKINYSLLPYFCYRMWHDWPIKARSGCA